MMNTLIQKISFLQQSVALSQATRFLQRPTTCIRHPIYGGLALVNERQHRTMPTDGIGRWRHLLPKEAPKKKKEQQQMKPITAASEEAYGTLSISVSGHDMTLVEHYAQYTHNLCTRLGVRVLDSYALPTKSTEIMLMQEQGTKMYVDAVLKTHYRVIQLRSLSTSLCPVLLNVLLMNQPEGVQLSVKEPTEADFQARFKPRPELEELMAQVSY